MQGLKNKHTEGEIKAQRMQGLTIKHTEGEIKAQRLQGLKIKHAEGGIKAQRLQGLKIKHAEGEIKAQRMQDICTKDAHKGNTQTCTKEPHKGCRSFCGRSQKGLQNTCIEDDVEKEEGGGLGEACAQDVKNRARPVREHNRASKPPSEIVMHC